MGQTTGYTIHIGGMKFPVTIEKVKVSTLKIDLRNPRMHSELGLKAHNGEVTAKEVADAIWSQNDTKQLFHQILADGGLIEPLFVRPNNVIAEGSRRRVVLDKILNDDEVAELHGITDEMRKQFEVIDIFRIPAEATEKDILTMLLDWHVSAKKAWSKPDQTEILLRLYEGGMDVNELARRTRQSPTTIRNRLGAYDLLKKFRERNPNNSNPTEQSHILNHYRLVQANTVLREWISADDANFDLFTSWVKDGKIEEGKDTRDRLPKIVEDPKALAALTNEELTVKETFEDFSKEKKRLFDIVSECARALRSASYREVTTFTSNKPKQRKLKKLQAAIAAFMENVEESEQLGSQRVPPRRRAVANDVIADGNHRTRVVKRILDDDEVAE
jgi:hypothetical protein